MCSLIRCGLLTAVLVARAMSSAHGQEAQSAPPQAGFSVARMLVDCDLVILGSRSGLPRTSGSSQIREIVVVRVIASVLSHEETLKMAAIDQKGAQKVTIVEKLPFTLRHVPLPVFSGVTYLLFLKRAKVAAVNGSKPGPVLPYFRVLAGWQGTILVSDPKQIQGYAQLMARAKRMGTEKFTPWAQQDRLLQKTCGTKDARAVLAAVETLAWAMADETHGRLVLEKLAQSKQRLYATPAKELLKLPRIQRFRFIGREAGDPARY